VCKGFHIPFDMDVRRSFTLRASSPISRIHVSGVAAITRHDAKTTCAPKYACSANARLSTPLALQAQQGRERCRGRSGLKEAVTHRRRVENDRCFVQPAQSAQSRAKGDYFPFELMFQLSEVPFLG
jgi:hypothetical protein